MRGVLVIMRLLCLGMLFTLCRGTQLVGSTGDWHRRATGAVKSAQADPRYGS